MKVKWKKYFFLAGIVLVVLALMVSGYFIPFFGFGDFVSPTGEFQRGKTIWDWLDLLIIPVALAWGAYYLNKEEKKLEREIAKDRQQEAALQSYIDRMSELLLEKKLRTTKNQEVRDVAKTRTISVMRGLDKDRNNLVLNFLREAKLVTDRNSILNDADMAGMVLVGLDLTNVFIQNANLREANLKNAKMWNVTLQGADLRKANLQGADLGGANLQGADLGEANLQQATLDIANLQEAKLFQTNLQEARMFQTNFQKASLYETNLQRAIIIDVNMQSVNLTKANLQKAKLVLVNMVGATVTEKQIAKAETMEGTTMPDGTLHE